MTNLELDKLRSAFFEESDIILAVMDKNLDLIDANKALLSTFKFKREEIIGKNIKELSPDIENTGRIEAYKEVLRTGKTIVIEEMRPHPSLGNFYFRIKVFKIGDGVGFIVKNITDLKNAIDELQTFIYKSSHDLRSPIASVLGIINLTNSSATTMKEARELRDLAEKQIRKLDSILSSLISAQKFQIIEPKNELIDFSEILNDVLGDLKFTIGFNEISFEKNITEISNFYSDKQLLTSVLLNLIDNAIKYKKENIKTSYIKISIRDSDSGVIILVEDNGIGINEYAQKKVYEMFYRGTNLSSGSGLGLYTVGHSIKKLLGEIKLESKEGFWTKVSINIPNAKPLKF